MKRYTVYDESPVSPGYTKHESLGIPFDGKKVFDIYLAKVIAMFSATVAGTVVLFHGLSYKTLELRQFATANNGELHRRRDLIFGQSLVYQVPSEYITEEYNIDFAIKPYTIWCSPSFVTSFSLGNATATMYRNTLELWGDIRTPTEEEWVKLQLEQRQEKQ